MRPGSLVAVCLAAAAFATEAFGATTIDGVASVEIAAALLFGAGILWLTGQAVAWSRPGWGAAIGAFALWATLAGALTALYLRRDAAAAHVRALAEDLGLGEPVATVIAPGEVAVTRRRDGTFRVPATIDGHRAEFMFDTGASAAVLTNETAASLGIRPDAPRFRIPVATANGRTLAAPATIAELRIGPIVMRNVPVLVVGPKLLGENLLGASVLDRLDSYEVRANRLVLRAGKG